MTHCKRKHGGRLKKRRRTTPSHIVVARAKTQKIKTEVAEARAKVEQTKKAELQRIKLERQEARKAKLKRMKARRQLAAEKKWREYLDSFGCSVPDFGRRPTDLAVAS